MPHCHSCYRLAPTLHHPPAPNSPFLSSFRPFQLEGGGLLIANKIINETVMCNLKYLIGKATAIYATYIYSCTKLSLPFDIATSISTSPQLLCFTLLQAMPLLLAFSSNNYSLQLLIEFIAEQMLLSSNVRDMHDYLIEPVSVPRHIATCMLDQTCTLSRLPVPL